MNNKLLLFQVLTGVFFTSTIIVTCVTSNTLEKLNSKDKELKTRLIDSEVYKDAALELNKRDTITGSDLFKELHTQETIFQLKQYIKNK